MNRQRVSSKIQNTISKTQSVAGASLLLHGIGMVSDGDDNFIMTLNSFYNLHTILADQNNRNVVCLPFQDCIYELCETFLSQLLY